MGACNCTCGVEAGTPFKLSPLAKHVPVPPAFLKT